MNLAPAHRNNTVATDHPARRGLRLATGLALLVAGAMLSIWLWSRICRFPSVPWNDMRLAPTIALAQGWSVYPTAASGTINTWMYGPLPLLFFWPASWASGAAQALMVAAWLNAALTVIPLALVCFLWPSLDRRWDSTTGRTVAFLLCFALWPELHYSVMFSDNLAIACGLMGNLLLVRARTSGELWLAAFVATAAIACKQIALGIPLAQIIFLGITAGRQAAGRHALRCIVAGAGIGGMAIAVFGWHGLWFTLVDIPRSLRWASDLLKRLTLAGFDLALLVGLPAAVMLAGRRSFVRPTLLLPALAWACTLPLGVAGLLKVGGWSNSIHSFVLWLPPVVATLLTSRPRETERWAAFLGAALIAVAIASGRLLNEPSLPLRPQVADYREAEQFAARNRGALWFPIHPLITLYSDRRYYHDEDGMYVHMMARKPISPEQAASQLPIAMRMIAFRNDWNDWGIARRMLPPNASETMIGNWTLRSGVATSSPP